MEYRGTGSSPRGRPGLSRGAGKTASDAPKFWPKTQKAKPARAAPPRAGYAVSARDASCRARRPCREILSCTLEAKRHASRLLTHQQGALTVRLLATSAGTGTTELLRLAPAGVGHQQGAVVGHKNVLDLALGRLVNILLVIGHDGLGNRLVQKRGRVSIGVTGRLGGCQRGARDTRPRKCAIGGEGCVCNEAEKAGGSPVRTPITVLGRGGVLR